MRRDVFEKLCELARLGLTDDERTEFERKFNRLLGFVEKVNSYEPKSEGPPMTLSERVDLRLDNARQFDWPDFTSHEYKVPTIIDFEGGS